MSQKPHTSMPAHSRSPATVDETAQIVAGALNEQGYLFHHKVLNVLLPASSPATANLPWHVEASEVPVSLPSGDETRIDLVLRLGKVENSPWRVVMECKRAAREFKHWVFFGNTTWRRGPSPNTYYIQRADLHSGWNNQGKPPLLHRVDTCPATSDCPVYDYGVEVRLNRKGSNDKSSATEAIENSFQQVTLGQAGLALRLWSACELNFRFLPVVVTTANLMSARIPVEKVSLDYGKIEPADLQLEPRNWLAVNFRVNDGVCQQTQITTHARTALAEDLAARQVRTVFVVQSAHIQPFLIWLDSVFQTAVK